MVVFRVYEGGMMDDSIKFKNKLASNVLQSVYHSITLAQSQGNSGSVQGFYWGLALRAMYSRALAIWGGTGGDVGMASP